MSYCLLRQDARREYWTGLGLSGVQPQQRLSATMLEDVELPVRVQLSVAGTLPSDFLELPCCVMSTAMRKALERTGVDSVQYFPAQLKIDYAADVIEGYWFANVIGLVSCVDRQASTFEPSGLSEQGELRGFRVDPLRCYGLSMFRLAEDPRLVVISTRLRAVLEGAGLHGLLFQETESYTGYRAHSATDALEPESETGIY
jgi:hypothetical protein